MPIREVSLFAYRSYLKDRNRPWSDAELGVLRFVKAIKKRPVNDIGGPAPLRVNGKIYQIGRANPEDAFKWFGQLAIDILIKELGTTRVVLVPVPDSGCTRFDTSARTVSLAESVALNCDAAVHDLLRWKKPMPPARAGGSRRPEILFPNLRAKPGFSVTKRPYVMIDDVATTGGHVRACAAALKRWGNVDVPLAIAGAQTAMEPVDDPYAQLVRTHEDFVP